MTEQLKDFVKQIRLSPNITFVKSDQQQITRPHTAQAYSTEEVLRGVFEPHKTFSVPDLDLAKPLCTIAPEEIGIIEMSEEQLYALTDYDDIKILYEYGEVYFLSMLDFWAAGYEVVKE